MSSNLRRPSVLLSLCATLLGAAPALAQKPAPPPAAKASAPAKAPATVSDVLKAPRPQGGEYLGLYLVDKKVGYLFSDVGYVPGRKDRVRSISALHVKAPRLKPVVQALLDALQAASRAGT